DSAPHRHLRSFPTRRSSDLSASRGNGPADAIEDHPQEDCHLTPVERPIAQSHCHRYSLVVTIAELRRPKCRTTHGDDVFYLLSRELIERTLGRYLASLMSIVQTSHSPLMTFR